MIMSVGGGAVLSAVLQNVSNPQSCELLVPATISRCHRGVSPRHRPSLPA